ncbi:MAG: DNA mismatch repair endonuclease MutL [Eubacterium sp.]|nr:DNA mismatch repair endonuclease MutL [Eubacterium sp.]
MAEIKVLDQDTINQIAAGEVVERPASIVKELVENAIDARSSAVTVEIKGGGIDFIRITDNGCGIEESQVRTAFLSHATSKIRSAEDLETVASLGFRGEALSSIAAVSKVEVITKTDEGISGIRYVIEGGEEVSYEVIGCPEGTTFLIRNLFYNTPARRKFLKSAMTEAGYVEAFIQRLAISHPDISFKFISDNKNKISTSGNGNLKDVIYHIYGRDIALNLLEVKDREEDIEVTGYIGKPVICRGNRAYENYFVNGRYLKNPIITKAIEDGYKGHSMVHKFPFTALMIHMDPHSFDANVHPSKMEMRFHKGEILYSVISRAVKESFTRKELIPRVNLEEKKESRKKAGQAADLPEPFESKRKQIEERFSRLSKEQIKSIQDEKKQTGEESPGNSGRDTAGHSGLAEKLGRLKLDEKTESLADIDKKMRTGTKKEPGSKPLLKEPDHYGTGKVPDSYGQQMKLEDIPFFAENAKPRYRLIGQVFGTYWMFEYEEKLFFVDQHAAHEKVMYEKMRKDLQGKKVSRQLLAPPIILSLNLREQERLRSCLQAFHDLGYTLEEFGGNEYCIREVPADLIDLDSRDLFVELLDTIDDNTGKMSLDALTDKLASMACKAAVKGNRSLSLQEMEALMDQLMELENPYQCPHGRPTIISMTKKELEKKFHRIQ